MRIVAFFWCIGTEEGGVRRMPPGQTNSWDSANPPPVLSVSSVVTKLRDSLSG